jgi:hypothetical protein
MYALSCLPVFTIFNGYQSTLGLTLIRIHRYHDPEYLFKRFRGWHMKRIMTIFLMTVTCAAPVMADDYSKNIDDSRAMVREFMQTLKQELQKGMQQGGPVNAVSVCNLTAPGIARTYSARKGWEVGRTSLRTRNPNNAPDTWERAALESFDERQRAGEDPAKLEFHEIVTTNGKRELRYMKAIPTGGLCLACHGEQLDLQVKTRIETLYPHDQALGYKVGDIRGAFTITQPLGMDSE